MHIPDGYLSLQTTIPAFVGMVPVWGAALSKIRKSMSGKSIPTLALCAAFSFVIMMFNIPIAGGSSAHAVGAVFIAILMGPWAAVISVTAALLIQALVFGDGGIMSFAVNCLNMAVIMPFTGYFIYKVISSKTKIGSPKNLAAAFAGSYAGLNISALCAAVEFGIQPLLFKASDGTPLFCPYPLSVSIPAMMLDHTLIAGPIEGLLTVLAVSYLVKFAPDYFQANCFADMAKPESAAHRSKAFLVLLGILVVLTPLGLAASGTAWGEWGKGEIKAALGYIPQGFSSLSDMWHALLPDYTIPALGDNPFGAAAGYILLAVIGVALVGGLIFASYKIAAKKGKGD